MSYTKNDALILEETDKNSKSLLSWYENFKHTNLSDLKEYFEVCDASERHLVAKLISSSDSLDAELKQFCDKSLWQFMPLHDWNVLNNNLHNKLKSLKDGYTQISPKILAHQESSNLVLE